MPDPSGLAGYVRSVNVGRLVLNPAKGGATAIGKRPLAGPVGVRAPEPGESGLVGDSIGDKEHHGGTDQAVYAFAREDLDWWEGQLGRVLADGVFGENLTTVGVDPNQALIGEQWAVGQDLVLQVTSPRLPCKTFAALMAQEGWARRFTETGRPGAYFRVVQPGPVQAGDPVVVRHRPGHGVTITMAMFAFTLKPGLLIDLLAAGDDLPEEMRDNIQSKLK